MRYVRTVLIPDEGLHPVDMQFAESSNITRERLHSLNLLDDGTAVVLYELTGDVERIRSVLEECPEVIDYQLSESQSQITIYGHFEPPQILTDLMKLLDRHQLIINMPIEYTSRGGLRALIVGNQDTIREAAREAPGSIRLKLEQMGQYEPETDRLFSTLTKRQQETLMAALEAGYYEVPRQATHRDVAETLDRSDGTVGEHLRKIEQRVFSAIAPR